MKYKNKEEKKEKFKLTYALSLITQIGVAVSLTSGIFILSGIYADRYFGTSPVFIILGAIIALAASMYEVYLLVLPFRNENGNGTGEKRS